MKLVSFCLLLMVQVATACRTGEDLPTTGKSQTTMVPGEPVTVPDFVLGAYLPYWGLANYQAYAYEDINVLYIITTISQATVLQNKGLIWGDNDASPDAYQQPPVAQMLAHIRSRNPGIRILLALSDLHTNDAARAATAQLFNSTNRAQTIQYLMSGYVDKFGFDGIDIDFEDSSLDAGYIGSNYPLFIRDLAAALHNASARGRRKLCTVTLGIYDHQRSNINQDVYQNVDLLGPQDYGREKMDYLLAEPPRNLAATCAAWSAKLPKSKLVFGLGLWSQYAKPNGAGAGDAMGYGSLLKMNPADTTFTPWLTTYFNTPGQPAGYVQRYNSLFEARRKAEFIKNGQFRGLFAWDITKDAFENNYRRYSILKLLKDWHDNPANYPPIVGFTYQDYYSAAQDIVGGFHSVSASAVNWVGIYELKTGNSIGFYQYLPNSASGTFTIPASAVHSLTPGKLYILRFYRGAGGIGEAFLGTSHPFYRL